MSFSLFPIDDHVLATRLKRQLMGFVSYLMFLVPLVYSIQQGWVRFGYAGLVLFLALALAINVGFFIAIRSGFTQRFSDLSLMMAQICIAGSLALALVIRYYVVDAAMVIVLMLFFTAFFFGIFSFSTRQYLLLTCAAALGYGIMLLLKYPAPCAVALRFAWNCCTSRS